MNELIKIINDRVNKELGKQCQGFIKSKPAIVNAVSNTDVTVTMLDTNSQYVLPNRSGIFVNVNDRVQVFYTGDVIDSNSAYVGSVCNGQVVMAESDFDKSTAQENVLYFLYK